MIARETLIAELTRIVGAGHVLTGERQTRAFTKGFRYGGGPVAAVVRPGSLVEQWRALNAIVASGRIVIFQAANTGLTGGSTPWGEDYDREIVLVSLRASRASTCSPTIRSSACPGPRSTRWRSACAPWAASRIR